MKSKFNKEAVVRQAQGLSFHMLKSTIEHHFVAKKVNEEGDDDLSKALAKRSKKMVNIFMEEAWRRSPDREKISLGRYKKAANVLLEERYAKLEKEQPMPKIG